MFEITPDDIAKLDDTRLRELVGRLCEAELRNRGHSTSAVTWGGDQNAKDGGVDVRVSLTSGDWDGGFIPRHCTGFQVKRQDMPPRAIAPEMRPKGKLRPVISDLAASNGAYVIVSSLGTTADSALQTRRQAMEKAVDGVAGSLHIDFYDRTRLASWVRDHPGIVVWVRETIGRAISGWHPFGPWAYRKGGVEASYLMDEGVRIRRRASARSEEVSTGEGLSEIRDILRRPGGVVRLVGLSGVGKTRFVQALFDDRVGAAALAPALAVYTNTTDEPDPHPAKLTSDLISNRVCAVVIVDNCPSELHARLTDLVKSSDSSVSVLTVEYDIRDDLPEETAVFEIRAASVDLIEKLLQLRFPRLSRTNARTAAEFSCGNARIAIALADTVDSVGTLAKLNNAELFKRLFAQRQGHDQSLLEIAQACALVYSFDGEDLSDDAEGELQRIAGLAGVEPIRAHRHIAELLRRELAQRRGKWRAILPHALANYLAAIALQNISRDRIEAALTHGAPERLVISFARRLGYLEKSEEAKAIVEDWLAPHGWIGEHVWNLSDFGQTVFRNCVPAAPLAALNALESNKPSVQTVSGRSLAGAGYIARTLRSLAWEAGLFDRCAALLQFLAVEGDLGAAREIHSSLFHMYLSGTHASIDQRLRMTQKLLQASSEKERNLGLSALKALLQCSYFTSQGDFQFGAHSRDSGYQPQSHSEYLNWYRRVLSVAAIYALSSNPVQYEVRDIIAASFRSLWTQVGLRDELDALSMRLAARAFWVEGWRQVQLTRHYDERNKSSENYARLSALELALRPRNLVQRIQARVFNGSIYDVDEVDPMNSSGVGVAMERQNSEVEALAAELVAESSAFEELMPELFTTAGNVWHFGIGLARAADEPEELWKRMIRGAERIPESRRDLRVLGGFLFELANRKSPSLVQMLDDAVEHDALASRFPHLQPPVANVPGGISRLLKSVKLGRAPIARFADIHFGGAVEIMPTTDIADFIVAIAEAEEGVPIALGILGHQFFDDDGVCRPHAKPIVEAGRSILHAIDFSEVDDAFLNNYQLQLVLKACTPGDDARATVQKLCANMRRAKLDHKLWEDCHEVLKILACTQPRTLLDTLGTGDEAEVAAGADLLRRSSLHRGNPLDGISDEIILEWCSVRPADRFFFIAAVASIFDGPGDNQLQTWRPLAARLVHDGDDPIGVMAEFFARLRPTMWSGERSVVVRKNAELLARFDTRDDPALSSFIQLKHDELIQEAGEDEVIETRRNRDIGERFE